MEKLASTASSTARLSQQVHNVIFAIKNLSFLDWLSVLNFVTIAWSLFALYAVSENTFTKTVYIGFLLSVAPSALSWIIKKERNNLKLASLILGMAVWGAWFIIIHL